MQTLYGVRCTDRITVETFAQHFAQHDQITYFAYFDGVEVARSRSGKGAVNAAKGWLQARQKQRELDAKREKQNAAEQQRIDDRVFIDELAYDLKIDSSRIDKLLEIAARRSRS
ncbi:MAG: hypothetical protein WAT79_04940 [Saprospiraceae bacterium]